LRTHALHGEQEGAWSFSIDARYRILFTFLDNAHSVVAFLDIGTHKGDSVATALRACIRKMV
jgi:mRNA-degrading endonuclease YafQ of YafQ-DinJ toxin-antitoxin module